ncbi:MAG: flagellar type III secretion system pore protein FliP [Bacillota bacterium]
MPAVTKSRWAALFLLVMLFILAQPAWAAPIPLPDINLQVQQTDQPDQVVDSIRLLLLLTVLSVAPAILIMMTSFTRTVIVLAFVRNALATQQIPPNQVLIGLAIFLTMFTMAPVYQQVKTQAIDPYLAEQITQDDALNAGAVPIREFMYKHTREKDLALFVSISGMEKPQNRHEVPIQVIIPAFVISELKTAFQMGFLIYIPFLIVDMVVASTLMSMGMFMVPPVMISLPFKILLFVMVDGWYLVVKSIVEGYR